METIIKKQGIVKAKSNAAQGLRDLFEAELKEMFWAEKSMIPALKKMTKNASSPELIRALKKHLTETEEHITRLERTFDSIGNKADEKKCKAMEGLIKECEIMMSETELGDVRDAGIIAAAQKVEHYEIATYGTLHAYAVTLGEEKAEELIAMTLAEEKKVDAALTKIALSNINIDAADLDDEW
ncbi:YciE/YciF ferroxidase family protein [Flavobacterium soyangense]|uniref:Ferritin-like domain-containing protein n=1 Tax=Flavobacterium soyangense TaxID=2023265 RepID=A0A930UA01_9FLAO|nr:ferritin-like domain-containing protein [Flavobacterium soyangense]MBF2707604.1 ferritin-like domain-containing protein [Flavobacterium soyangense]